MVRGVEGKRSREEYPLPSRLWGLGERHKLSRGVCSWHQHSVSSDFSCLKSALLTGCYCTAGAVYAVISGYGSNTSYRVIFRTPKKYAYPDWEPLCYCTLGVVLVLRSLS